MSLLIKGMDMPKNGEITIAFASDENGENTLALILDTNGKPIEHKGVAEIRTPHGRLIDADALIKDLQGLRELFPSSNIDYFGGVISLVKNSPTIIEMGR